MHDKHKNRRKVLLISVFVIVSSLISILMFSYYFKILLSNEPSVSNQNYYQDRTLIKLSQESQLTIDESGEIGGGLTTFLARGESIPTNMIAAESIYELPYSNVDDQENGALRTITSKIKGENIYKLSDSDINLTTISISWNAGTLYMGSDPTDLKPVDLSIDPDEYRSNLLSVLYYIDGTQIYLVSTTDTTVSIDSYNTSVQEGDKITPSKPADFINKDSGAKYSELPIISRDSWGANTYSWDPYSSSDIDSSSRFTWQPGYYRASRIVIHHTATNNTYPDPSKAIRDIYLYHTYSQGWGDIGYNFLIDDRGNIYEGKAGGDEVFGYHALTEANTMSVGIALIGNFENYSPTQAQIDSLSKLIAEKSLLYGFSISRGNGSYQDWVDQSKTIFTDRDVWFWCYDGHKYDNLCPYPPSWARRATACPGQNLQNIMDSTIVPLARFYAENSFQKTRDASVIVSNTLAGTSADLRKFIVEYDLPESIAKEEIEGKIPQYSGIFNYQINRNQLLVEVGDWNDGVLIPYIGWDGQAPGVYFPASGGPKDRVETLMKLFLLDPSVKNVGVEKTYKLSD